MSFSQVTLTVTGSVSNALTLSRTVIEKLRCDCHVPLPRNIRCSVGTPEAPTENEVVLAQKGALYEGDDGIVLLVRKFTSPPITSPAPTIGRFARLIGNKPIRIYVPLLMQHWVIIGCHTDMSCRLGSARTLQL